MFDISFSELLIIAIVALLVLGPERLPKVARTLGHLMGRAQRYMNDVKRDIQKEMELEDIKDLKKEMAKASSSVKSSIQDLGKEFKDPLTEFERDLKDPFIEARDAIKNLQQETTDGLKSQAKQPDPAQSNSPQAPSAHSEATQEQPTPPVASKTAAALRAGSHPPKP